MYIRGTTPGGRPTDTVIWWQLPTLLTETRVYGTFRFHSALQMPKTSHCTLLMGIWVGGPQTTPRFSDPLEGL